MISPTMQMGPVTQVQTDCMCANINGVALTCVRVSAMCKKNNSLEFSIPLFTQPKMVFANIRCKYLITGLWIDVDFRPSQSDVASPIIVPKSGMLRFATLPLRGLMLYRPHGESEACQ